MRKKAEARGAIFRRFIPSLFFRIDAIDSDA